MKKLFTLLLLFTFTSTIFGAGNEGHNIKFKIKGLRDSVCYIGYYYGKTAYTKQDTAKADAEGNLVFKGKKPLPGGVYLLVIPKAYIEFIVSEQTFSMETDYDEPVLHMKIKGSPENEIFYRYQKFTYEKGSLADSLSKVFKQNKDEKIKKRIEAIDKDVTDFRKKLFVDYPQSLTTKLLKGATDVVIPDAPLLPDGKPDSTFPYRYYKAHYFDNIDLTDERLVRTPFFHSRIEKYFKNLVVQDPDSINHDADEVLEKMKLNKEMFKYTLWHVFNTYESSQLMGMDAVTVHMTRKYYLSGRAWWVDTATLRQMKKRVDIMEPLLLNKQAPPLYSTDTNGKTIPLYNIQAKYTILFFWDSDCWHCQKETPELYEWYVKNKNKGIAVYAHNIERRPQGWKNFIHKNKLYEWINVQDGNLITDHKTLYDIYSTPVLYILDADKKIIAKRVAVDQLDEFFKKYERFTQNRKENKK
ncbi:MAG: DUF5106 domain-containing protein [Bacteroidetes bacterium]|nr:DUF5106 domain-containing protein [Bacteroidota bacterium]